MHPFSYVAADNEQAAIAAAAAGGRYVAGGTTLIDLMREEVEQPQRLIDINPLPLRTIRLQDNALVVGALARMSDVAAHPAVRGSQPLIAEALIEGASPQIRNMASIGGNLLQRVRCPYFRTLDAPCNKRTPGSGCSAIDGINTGHALFGTSAHCVATHPSDLAVALVALDATVTLRRPAGERRMPVEDLYRLPGETPHLEHTLEPGELIVEVQVPHGRYARRARYLKVRDRASYEFAVVSVAAALDVTGASSAPRDWPPVAWPADPGGSALRRMCWWDDHPVRRPGTSPPVSRSPGHVRWRAITSKSNFASHDDPRPGDGGRRPGGWRVMAPSIGTALSRVDGRSKVTGAARYAAEFNQPGQAYAVMVSGAAGLGRIMAVDASAAMRLPGVIAILTHHNAPRLLYHEHRGFVDPPTANASTSSRMIRSDFLASRSP